MVDDLPPNWWESDTFEPAALKVEWAKQHISNLDKAVGMFAENVYSVTADFDAEAGEYVCKIDIRPAGPIFPLLIGDAAHALRGALDYCWNVLARKAVQSKARLTFPMHETLMNLKDVVSKSPVAMAFPQVVPLVLNDIRPYKEPRDGNSAIWAVGQIDNIDKHNLLIPAINFSTIPHLKLTSMRNGKPSLWEARGIQLTGNGPLEVMRSAHPIEIYQDSQPAFDVAFEKGQPFEGLTVVEALADAAEAVSEAVDLFKKQFGVRIT